MNLVLIGFKKSGKTIVGKLLAESLNFPFFDVDELITDLFSTRGLSCYEIFKRLGEEGFYKLEKKAVVTLEGVKDAVIATGGRTVMGEDNVKVLKKGGKFIYLFCPLSVLKMRILRGEASIFLDCEDPQKYVENIYWKRCKVYEQLSDITVRSDRELDEVIDEIKEQLSRSTTLATGDGVT